MGKNIIMDEAPDLEVEFEVKIKLDIESWELDSTDFPSEFFNNDGDWVAKKVDFIEWLNSPAGKDFLNEYVESMARDNLGEVLETPELTAIRIPEWKLSLKV